MPTTPPPKLLIHHYHPILGPHLNFSSCFSNVLYRKRLYHMLRLVVISVFLLQFEAILPFILNFHDLSSFEHYRPVILYTIPQFGVCLMIPYCKIEIICFWWKSQRIHAAFFSLHPLSRHIVSNLSYYWWCSFWTLH